MQMSIDDHVFGFLILNAFAELKLISESIMNLIDLELECLDHKFWLREQH